MKRTNRTAQEQRLRLAYANQKARAKQRLDIDGKPIEMVLTFEQWLAVWNQSGMLHKRGREKGCYVMGRLDDRGHYARGNVEIIPQEENHSRASKAYALKRQANIAPASP